MKRRRDDPAMQRAVLYSLVLCVLLSVDIAANNGLVTREIIRAVVGVGESTTEAVDATAAFMVGR